MELDDTLHRTNIELSTAQVSYPSCFDSDNCKITFEETLIIQKPDSRIPCESKQLLVSKVFSDSYSDSCIYLHFNLDTFILTSAPESISLHLQEAARNAELSCGVMTSEAESQEAGVRKAEAVAEELQNSLDEALDYGHTLMMQVEERGR